MIGPATRYALRFLTAISLVVIVISSAAALWSYEGADRRVYWGNPSNGTGYSIVLRHANVAIEKPTAARAFDPYSYMVTLREQIGAGLDFCGLHYGEWIERGQTLDGRLLPGTYGKVSVFSFELA